MVLAADKYQPVFHQQFGYQLIRVAKPLNDGKVHLVAQNFFFQRPRILNTHLQLDLGPEGIEFLCNLRQKAGAGRDAGSDAQRPDGITRIPCSISEKMAKSPGPGEKLLPGSVI